METQRNELYSRSGVCLWTALVLVSGFANPDFERNCHHLSSARMDVHGGRYRGSQRIYRFGRGMAAVRRHAARIPVEELGRKTSIGQYFLRGGNREFCASGSDRKVCFANVRRRASASNDGEARYRRVRGVSKTHAKQNGNE